MGFSKNGTHLIFSIFQIAVEESLDLMKKPGIDKIKGEMK